MLDLGRCIVIFLQVILLSSGICGLESFQAGGGVCLIAYDFSPLTVFEIGQIFLQCCFENFASLGVSLLFWLGRFPCKGVNSEGLKLFSCKNQEWDNYSCFFFHAHSCVEWGSHCITWALDILSYPGRVETSEVSLCLLQRQKIPMQEVPFHRLIVETLIFEWSKIQNVAKSVFQLLDVDLEDQVLSWWHINRVISVENLSYTEKTWSSLQFLGFVCTISSS